jgi:hypothetical protein
LLGCHPPAGHPPAVIHLPAIHLLAIHLPAIHLLAIHLPAIHLLAIHLPAIHLPAIHLLAIHLLAHLPAIHLLAIHLLAIHLLAIHLPAIHPALNKASPAARPRDQIYAARCAVRVLLDLHHLPLLFCEILWPRPAVHGSWVPRGQLRLTGANR